MRRQSYIIFFEQLNDFNNLCKNKINDDRFRHRFRADDGARRGDGMSDMIA